MYIVTNYTLINIWNIYSVVYWIVNTGELYNPGVFYNTSRVPLVTISGCSKNIHKLSWTDTEQEQNQNNQNNLQ